MIREREGEVDRRYTTILLGPLLLFSCTGDDVTERPCMQPFVTVTVAVINAYLLQDSMHVHAFLR